NSEPHRHRRLVERRLEKRRGAPYASNDYRNSDWIQQDRQQHVAGARPHEHRREQRSHGRESERAGSQQQHEKQWALEERRAEEQRYERDENQLGHAEQRQDTQQLADVKSGPRRRGQQQRAKRFAVPFPFERAAERQRPRKRDGDPENSRRRVLDGAALLDE